MALFIYILLTQEAKQFPTIMKIHVERML